VKQGLLDIADTGLAAYQLSELYSSGLMRQHLFGYRTRAARAGGGAKDGDGGCRPLPQGLRGREI